MKLANSELIESAKNEWIAKLKQALDLKIIKQLLEEQHNIDINGDIEVSNGKLEIHNNHIVHKMEFEVLLSLSILVDEKGNYIPPEKSLNQSITQLGSQAQDIIQNM